MTCAVCGKKWTVKASRAKQNASITCSRDCFREQARRRKLERNPPGTIRTATCAHCGAGFERKPSQLAKYATAYCSVDCRLAVGTGLAEAVAARRNGQWHPCQHCGRPTWRTPGTLQPNVYCSRPCANRVRSAQARAALSRTLRALHATGLEEQRRRHADRMRGPRNPQWRDGRARRPYEPGFTRHLKRSIAVRDRHRCRICGAPQGHRTHAVHHIDGEKHNHAPSNLILLCHSCHGKVHQRMLRMLYPRRISAGRASVSL